ncbi:MAG TPA: glycosyltransferase [Thermoanaerobaculia bacterium]
MERERIAIFVPNLEGGGAERVMSTLANRFVRDGFRVEMVLMSATGPYLDELDDRVAVVDLGARRLMRSAGRLARYLRSNRPDAMISTPGDANVIAWLAWKLAGSKGRLVMREAVHESGHRAAAAGIRDRALAFLRRRAFGFASHIVAPSVGVAEDLVRNVGIAPERVTVIPNPLDLPRIEELARALVPDLPLGTDVPIVLGMGRLMAQKDFASLIRAFAIVRQSRNAVLVILGDGEERKALVELAEELRVGHGVMMPGFVANPFPYLRRAAVFVLSSRYEGLPNALLQAVALGIPVVATDCPSGPREILDEGRWGRLVPLGDVAAMAEAIIEGLDGRLDTMPREIVAERFGVEKIAGEYLAVLLDGGR